MRINYCNLHLLFRATKVTGIRLLPTACALELFGNSPGRHWKYLPYAELYDVKTVRNPRTIVRKNKVASNAGCGRCLRRFVSTTVRNNIRTTDCDVTK